MTQRIAQRAVVGLAAVAALLLATGCDNPVDPPAAKVDGVSISRDDLFAEANALAALPNDPYNLNVDTNNALNATVVSSVLSAQIAGVIYENQAERMGLEVDEEAVTSAREEILRSSEGTVPEDVINEVARRAATRQVVEEHVSTEQWWTDADIERYLEVTGEQACVRHIVVETEAEADDIIDQLDDGAEFEDLAAERSLDENTAENGGDLGCRPRTAFPDEFLDAMDDAEAGEVVGPINTSGAVYVVLVEEPFHEVPLEEARGDIEQLFADPQGAGWADFVLRTTDVDVDARFGSWDPLSGQVVPPQGAQPASSTGASSIE
jgi:parvulin-like peptidyl-prolyl isomerase